MKNSPEILNELMTISPLLAGLDKVNVFQVPDGYFTNLHLRITDYAILNNQSPTDNTNRTNFQRVPEGYFDSLSDTILAKIRATYPESAGEELSKLSPVLNELKNINVFSVPEGYFDSLSDFILNAIRIDKYENPEEEIRNLSATLSGLKDQNVFATPEGYFDSLSDSVLNKIKGNDNRNAQDELREISPLLYSIQGENVFSVPRGYFESLAEEITEKAKPRPAKIISMKKRTSWLKYAAAAVVAGIITVSSLQIFKGHKNNSSELATLPDYIKASLKYKTEAELNAGIAKLSDADIIAYLEKNGSVMDNNLLIKSTDVSELPSSNDYLMDANTLNKYLDKIDAANVSN